jgi:2-polyprenyl-3-methyl-5-hydroxy-6-metoxy-1,4-benzoquinol methylase
MCGHDGSRAKVLGKRLNKTQGIFPRNKKGITTTIVKCINCELIYSDPQPVPLDIQDHYGISPEHYWTDNYFHIGEGYFEHEAAMYAKLSQHGPAGKALDIGAGLGKAMTVLSKKGFDVYGFEPSATFHEQGLKRMHMDPEKYTLQTMENAHYPVDFFDFITFGAVLEHLYDPSSSIDKALDWLKPDGLIHIEVPSSGWLTNRIVNMIYKITGSDYVANISPMHTPFHLYEFSLESFIKNSLKAGRYEIAFHEYYVCPEFTYLPKFINIFTVPYMKWTDTGMQLCVWLKKK